MWYMIQRTAKDLKSPQVLNVQRVETGIVKEYNTQEDVEQVVQEGCEVRFSLAHRAPIMKHTLAKKLRYLEDEKIAKATTEETYEVPTDLDEPIKYVFEEIGKMGMNIINEEREEIVITPDDFKRF